MSTTTETTLATLTADDVTIDTDALQRIIDAEREIPEIEGYLSLTVTDHSDAPGIAEAEAALKRVKRLRIDLDKDRKTLKQPGLDFCRKLDAGVKRIASQITPIESHLQDLADIPKRYAEEQAAKAEAERKRIIADRFETLAGLEASPSLAVVEAMTDADYSHAVMVAEDAAAERARIEAEAKAKADAEAAERAAREAEERKRLEAERAELEKQRAAQKAEADRIEAEQKKQREALAEQQRKIDAENARIAREKAEAERLQREKEAAEQKRIEDQKREAERIEAEKKEAQRQAALQPIREQLMMFAHELDGIKVPDSLAEYEERIRNILAVAAAAIEGLAE